MSAKPKETILLDILIIVLVGLGVTVGFVINLFEKEK